MGTETQTEVPRSPELEILVGSAIASIRRRCSLGFVQLVRERLLGRRVSVSGRSIVDDQGAMVLADGFEIEQHDAQMRASELRAQWGWA